MSRYERDGSVYTYSGYNSSTRQFAPQEDDSSILKLVKTSPIEYELFESDGTIDVYATSDGGTTASRNVFLSRIIDPQGNVRTLNYGKVDGQLRLVSLKDAAGGETKFIYGSKVSPLLITKITDPFGRSAELAYESDGRLGSLTDVLGLKTTFTYDATSTISGMQKPYGKFRTSSIRSAMASASKPASRPRVISLPCRAACLLTRYRRGCRPTTNTSCIATAFIGTSTNMRRRGANRTATATTTARRSPISTTTPPTGTSNGTASKATRSRSKTGSGGPIPASRAQSTPTPMTSRSISAECSTTARPSSKNSRTTTSATCPGTWIRPVG